MAEAPAVLNIQAIQEALTKALNHVEVEPKAKHVETLIRAVGPDQPLSNATYIADVLYTALHIETEWLIVTKVLMTIHHLMRSNSVSFFDALVMHEKNVGKVGSGLKLENFMDNSGSKAVECSKWVNDYSGYVNKRKELYRKLKLDPNTDKPEFMLKMDRIAPHDLVQVLPILKNCMHRLILAAPKGYKSSHNGVVQAAVLMMLRESAGLYKVLMEGMDQLVKHFYEMDRADAYEGMALYKECLIMHDVLEKYYHDMDELDNVHGCEHPQLVKPPSEIVEKMEEYVKSAQ